MGIFFSIWRRLFGGGDSEFKFLSYRGVQMVLSILAVFSWELYKGLVIGWSLI